MKVFVAIKLSNALVENLGQLRRRYRKLPVRWVPNEKLHITLVPPWEIDFEEKRALVNLLQGLKATSFDLSFDTIKMPIADIINSNPDNGMMWLYGPVPDHLVTLKDKLEKVLGFEFQRYEFQNHVTLARFYPEVLESCPVKQVHHVLDWHQWVDHIVLFESRKTGDITTYEALTTISLLNS